VHVKKTLFTPAAICIASVFMVAIGAPIGAKAQQNQAIPATTAEAAPPQTDIPQADVIVVVATRRGTARGNLKPNEVVDETQLEVARGLTIGQVIERIKRDGGYNTQILVNGRPADASISVDGLPSEAITRIDILPPETAASYGERVDGEVINVVLKSQFRSVQLGSSATANQNTSGLDFGNNVQRTVLEGEAQTSISATLNNTVARKSKPQSGDEIASLLAPGTYELDVSFQAQRPIKEGVFLLFGGNVGSGESDFSDGYATQSDISLIAATRSRWGLTSTFGANKTDYFYSLTAGLSGGDEDQRSALERNRKSNVNAQVIGSINGVLFKIKDIPINAGVTANWRSDRVRNSQSLDGLESILETRAEQSDVRATLAAPWSNNRGQEVGALSTTLGLEAILTDGVGGNSINTNVSWVPLPRLNLQLNSISSTAQPMQIPFGKPLVMRERVFDIVTRTERDVTVLRDENAAMAPVDTTQTDFTANYSIPTKWPIDLSLQASRSSSSGSFDRPESPSPELQLQQPSRYLRGSDGGLTTVDLRTRQLAQQTRNSISLNIGLRIPMGPKPTEDGAPANADASTTRAADAIAAASGELSISLNSQWQIVPRRGLRDDIGLGEATNTTSLRASWTQGVKSLTVTLNRIGPTLSRDIDGSLFTIPGTLTGGLGYSLPLEFSRGGRTYFKNTGLRAAVENIMLSQEVRPSGVNAQNRLSMSDQRGFVATLSLSKNF
jgi:hypothetical protein